MNDIAEQLRGRARFCRDRGEIKTPGLCEEAADEIERLRALVDFYEQERQFGAAKTFAGMPIEKAIGLIQSARATADHE